MTEERTAAIRPAEERTALIRPTEERISLIRPTGLVPYGVADHAMHDLADRRARGEVPDVLVLLEHPPVYTAGRRSHPTHVRWAEDQILRAGAELHHVDRGGSVTFHGPGQLVGYPILDLGPALDVIGYLRRLEEVVIRACHEIGVDLHRDADATGVWAGDRKVCAIGVRVAHARVTLHGFALNCTTDLGWFDAIVPCGLADRGVATLTQLARREVTVEEMAGRVARAFASVFELTLVEVPDGGGLWPATETWRLEEEVVAGTPAAPASTAG